MGGFFAWYLWLDYKRDRHLRRCKLVSRYRGLEKDIDDDDDDGDGDVFG